MDFGIQIRGDCAHVLRITKWVESQDVVAIALPDHYLERGSEPNKPPWDHLIHLAGLARETSLELVCMVSPVTFRHPAVLYKMGVTIDEISDGRFTLGANGNA